MRGPVSLEIPSAAASTVAEETRRFGRQILETGGFLLGPEGTEQVTVVALAGNAGIVRHGWLFEISELALDRLFGFASDQGCWILAQFHSHGFGDELSELDRDQGLRVNEFISAVVPEYRDPSCDPADWGWWRFETDRWVRVGPAAVTAGDVEVVVFDTSGVHGR